MDDFEKELRDVLRRVDGLPMPVSPPDPEAALSATGGTRGRWARRTTLWLAAAAVAVIAAGGVWVLAALTSRVVPAVPAQTASPDVAGAMVEVDVFSGQPNVDVPLDAGTTRELYRMLFDASGSLKRADPPGLGLGFRGLVVTPTDAILPQLRILPTTVYVNDDGSYRSLDDPSGSFYVRVYDAIRPALGTDVRDLIPAPTPTVPDTTATIPAPVGDAATWTLAEPVTTASTEVVLRVTRTTCSGGETGPLLDPVVSLGTDDIIIRIDAVPVGAANCPGNEPVTVSVTLPEPIGARSLMDAACLQGTAVRTQECSGGAVRWTP